MGTEALVSLVRRGHLRYEKQHRWDVGMGWSPGSGLDRTEASTVVLQKFGKVGRKLAEHR